MLRRHRRRRDAVAATYRLIAERAGDALEGVLVEEMLDGNRELLVGLKRDPVFGPVVAFGLGGVLTEVLGDVALALVPPSERDVAELPDLIRAKKLLGPVPRRSPPSTATLLAAGHRRRWRGSPLDFPEVCRDRHQPAARGRRPPVAADALVILGRRPAPRRRAARAVRARSAGRLRPGFGGHHRRLRRHPQVGRLRPAQHPRRRLRGHRSTR